MEKSKIWNIYNDAYVASYNDAFLLDPYSQAGANFELSIFKGIITNATRWLDIGCGTGYFLSQFPGTFRAGYDLSPAMLAQAEKVNPDAAFFRQGDFRNEVPEWQGQWSLVSCMWSAYSYVEKLAEVEKVVANMISWARIGGDIFIPVIDLEDLRTDVLIVPYEEVNPVYGGVISVTSCTWTWVENDATKVHKDMIAPHVEHFIRLLQPYFETIEVIRYPAFQKGWCTKKALLAKNKLLLPSPAHVADIIRHPIPPDGYQPQKAVLNPPVLSPASLSDKQLVKEFYNRIKSGNLLKACVKKLFRKFK